MAVPGVTAFMDSPLVLWAKTFSPTDPADFQEISEGTYLIDVMLHIYPKQVGSEVNRKAQDTNARLQNWHFLIRTISTYYQDVLQQLIVMEMPDITSIAKEPTKESSLAEIQNVLLLILGCAIQSDRKEDYISGIQKLDISVQQAIVLHIKEVTECPRNILQLDILTDLDEGVRDIAGLLRTVAAQRDNYSQRAINLTQERDYFKSEVVGKRVARLTPPPSLEGYHLQKEMGEYKVRLSQLNEDNEEKMKIVSDLKEDLQDAKERLKKLNMENLELRKDAVAARSYRDEVDNLKEQALKVDKFEKEILKYKEKLHELDYYKARVDELREDNHSLTEAKDSLESQLSSMKKRSDTLMDELVRNQLQLEEVNTEKDKSQKRIQELLEENSVLAFEHHKLSDEGLRKMRSYSSTEILAGTMSLLQSAPSGETIAQELKASQTSQVERENDELKTELEEVQTKLDKAEKEISDIKLSMEKEMEEQAKQLETQVREMKRRESVEVSLDYKQRINSLEQQSQQLQEKMQKEYQAEVQKQEKENCDLKNQVKQLKEGNSSMNESTETVQKQQEQNLAQVELQKHELNLEVQRLLGAVEIERDKCVQYEKLNKDLMIEKDNFKQTINLIKESSDCRIQELENQLEVTQSKTANIQSRNNRINSLCELDISNGLCEDSVARDIRVPHHAGLHRSHSEVGKTRGVVTPQRRERNDPNHAPIHRSMSVHGNMPSGGHHMGYYTPQPKQAKSNTLPHNRSMTPLGTGRPRTPDRWSVSSEIVPGSSHYRKEGKSRQAGRSHSRPKSSAPPLDRYDQSTPVRKTGYVAPMPITPFVKPCVDGHLVFREVKSIPASKQGKLIESSSETNLATDRGTEKGTEPDRKSEFMKNEHYLSSYQLISKETIHTTIRNSNMKPNERWKALVDKIVELQDKNQQLIVSNSELRRKLNVVQNTTQRMDDLEKRNLQLEVENRKLRKICETLQASHGNLPYDMREYQFHSAV